MLPGTQERVTAHTPAYVLRRIEGEMRGRLRYYALYPERIDSRLDALEREWDIERMLEANAAVFAFTGVALGALVDRRWLLLPAAVSVFLFQHAVQGWCPPLPVLRRLGVRTAREIETERHALEALRDRVRATRWGPERDHAFTGG